MSWKSAVKDSGKGYYTLHTEEIGAVPVRLFLTPNLLDQVEESIYPQIANAASFPGVKLVAIIRGGAAHYAQHYGERVDRTRTERDRLPVDDSWQPPWGGQGRPERGVPQLGTLGGGNHFIELQGNVGTHTLYVQLHSGSRGFGHGLATNYFRKAKEENPAIKALDLGNFTPESAHYRNYLNAVAAGGDVAIVNLLAMFDQIPIAFEADVARPPSQVYDVSS